MSVTITNTTLPTLLYLQAPFSLFASVTSGDWDTESPNRYSVSQLKASVSREWPIGRAVWLAGSVTPKTLGLPGTWKSYRWSLTTKVGSVLDVKDGRYDVAGAEVQIYSYNNSEAQRWHIYAEGPGIVTLWVRTA